jgi:hypothetical protein
VGTGDFDIDISVLVNTRARWLTYFSIGVTQFDGDISLKLILESDCLYTRDGSDGRGFPMSYMANRTDINLLSAGYELHLTVACFEMTSGESALSFVKSMLISSGIVDDEADADAWIGSLIESDMADSAVF